MIRRVGWLMGLPGPFGLACVLPLFAAALTVGAAEQGATAVTSTPPITLTPYRSGGIYARGEVVGWHVAVRPGAHVTGEYTFTAKKNTHNLLVGISGPSRTAANTLVVKAMPVGLR